MNELAKPSGVLLTDHNQHLLEQCKQIFSFRPVALNKYQAATGEDLKDLVRLAVRWHDEGKKHPQWQGACKLDYEDAKNGKSGGRHLMKAKIRHEIASLHLAAEQKIALPEVVEVAIGAHHGKLGYRHEDRWKKEHPEFSVYWDKLRKIATKLRSHEFEAAIRQRYVFSGPRALLQLADHRASATEAKQPVAPFKPFNYQFPHKHANGSENKRGVQRIVDNFRDEPLALLRAPTGSGKTDAALLWAQWQIAQGRADRLVIAMPTRFTANSLNIETPEEMSKGIYHSSAFLKAERHELEMGRLLETPITVTTIDHLCISLTGTREDHHSTFFNLANSCVVIDEADFYDEFTQQNIVLLLKALRLLKVPVLLMSATIPESARLLYQESGFVIPQIFEDTTDEGRQEVVRPRCRVKLHGPSTGPETVGELLQRGLDGEPMIIYANTVKRAQAYYRWFRDQECEHPFILYHSRFTEPDKALKEQALRELLGADVWNNPERAGKPSGIAILTQIGELSVNISADLMLSDLCPIDRLAQRVGRLSRFARVAGELHIVEPYTAKNGMQPYPAPYGRWLKDGWEPTPALIQTKALLSADSELSAQDFVDLVNQVYPDVPPIESRVRTNKRALEDAIVNNWLILPLAVQAEDDEDTARWRSRDIPAQSMIYADYPLSADVNDLPQSFDSWQGYRRFQLEHGIQCHSYEFTKAVDNSRLIKAHFTISSYSRDETVDEPGYFVKTGFYDSEQGLHFDLDQED